MIHLSRYQAALLLSPDNLVDRVLLAAMQREDGQEGMTAAAYLDWLGNRAGAEVRAYGAAVRAMQTWDLED